MSPSHTPIQGELIAFLAKWLRPMLLLLMTQVEVCVGGKSIVNGKDAEYKYTPLPAT